MKQVSIGGFDFQQVVCDGEFAENERIELIIFLHETKEADYNNYTSYKVMSYDYCEFCRNVLFQGTDSLSSSAYFAIYPVAGINYPFTNWHLINNLREYPLVFDKEIGFKGFYNKK